MIEFQNITVKENDRTVLDDFSLVIPDRVIMGLVGSDDAAKSCLLAVAGGVKHPDEGRVFLDEEPLESEDKNSDLYEQIGYMPGHYGFYDLLRLEEYFEFFLSLYRVNPRYWEKRTEAVLKLTDMEEFSGAYINEIPADRHPFLCLGKTILHDPEWLFLDDPFLGLNVSGRNQMISILLQLQEQGKSIVIQSQLFPELLDFYTDVTVIEEGRSIASGLIQDVYEIAMKQSPVRMHVIAGMDGALAVLKQNSLVERVTVSDMDVIFRFNGGAREEAELLADLVEGGALIQNYMRNHVNIEQIFKGGLG